MPGSRWGAARGGERLDVVHEVAAGAELVAERGGGGDLAELDLHGPPG
jgi:hypothetical protein